MKKKSDRLVSRLKKVPLPSPLTPAELRWQCDPKSLGVKTSDEVTASNEIIGQERAVRSLTIGLDMKHKGYNIFVTGLSGTGRTTTVRRLLEQVQSHDVHLRDHCFVYNFRNPDMPIAISLPAGQGRALKEEVETLIRELLVDIPAIYESQRYQDARKSVLQHFQDRQKTVLQDFEKKVKMRGFDLVQVQVGNTMRPDVVPVIGGNVVNLDQVEAMVEKAEISREQFEQMKETQSALEKQMALVFRELRNIERKVQESLGELEERLVMPIVDDAIQILKTTYDDPKVQSYLDDVRNNIRQELERFRQRAVPQPPTEDGQERGEDEFLEYKVNLLVDNSDADRAPIVMETNPKYKNIFGTIERFLERGGVWRTDFTQIKAGSLLRADGGYLVLNALDALIEPGVWQDLKRTLRTGKVEVHTYEPLFGIAPIGMKPEAIDLNVKVIMIGDPEIYHLLYFRDDDFKKVFKIRADFDVEIPKTDDTVQKYLQFVKTFCDEENLLPFDNSALAQLVEFGVRTAGRKKKLSTRFNIIADVVRESNYWAIKEKASMVTYRHVEKAITERIDRVRLVEDKIQEMINDGVIMIDTDGAVVGQVNGLSVYDLGEHAFGKPSRITARTSVGRLGVINIEREAELSGPTHNKGVAILNGFLRSKFAQKKPLVMDASITFEQSYGGVDGDSASSTEIYAILSSLAEIPIRQDIAVTGSVNQKGEIQPIGGVNLKIEGFYDVCKARGLTGTQGVIIPIQNVGDLMLREDVIEVVRAKKFHIYAISTIEEGIEVLTGVKAGALQQAGSFELGTVFALADQKLSSFAREWQKFEKGK